MTPGLEKFLKDIQYFAEESVKDPGPNAAVTNRSIIYLYERQRRPGTDAAMKAGCTCPRIDNHYGRGYRGNGARYGWLIQEGCRLHGSVY